jgi:hypothetical protein
VHEKQQHVRKQKMSKAITKTLLRRIHRETRLSAGTTLSFRVWARERGPDLCEALKEKYPHGPNHLVAKLCGVEMGKGSQQVYDKMIAQQEDRKTLSMIKAAASHGTRRKRTGKLKKK